MPTLEARGQGQPYPAQGLGVQGRFLRDSSCVVRALRLHQLEDKLGQNTERMSYLGWPFTSALRLGGPCFYV